MPSIRTSGRTAVPGGRGSVWFSLFVFVLPIFTFLTASSFSGRLSIYLYSISIAMMIWTLRDYLRARKEYARHPDIFYQPSNWPAFLLPAAFILHTVVFIYVRSYRSVL